MRIVILLFISCIVISSVCAQTYFYANDNLLAVESAGEKEFVFQNRLGSDTHTKSLPFGQEIVSKERFSFTGKELDQELYYFGARYYAANMGVFTSIDPVEEAFPYQYVHNNPINYVDPNGEEIQIISQTNSPESSIISFHAVHADADFNLHVSAIRTIGSNEYGSFFVEEFERVMDEEQFVLKQLTKDEKTKYKADIHRYYGPRLGELRVMNVLSTLSNIDEYMPEMMSIAANRLIPTKNIFFTEDFDKRASGLYELFTGDIYIRNEEILPHEFGHASDVSIIDKSYREREKYAVMKSLQFNELMYGVPHGLAESALSQGEDKFADFYYLDSNWPAMYNERIPIKYVFKGLFRSK